MYITTPTREKVPFDELATYTIKRGVVSINHLDGKRQINVEADMMNETSSVTEILAFVKSDLIPEILAKYPTVSVLYEGQNREAEKTQKSAAKALPVVLFLIIAMITFTFRSFGQTLLLFALIPFSLIGVAWGHYFHGHAISMLSMMGVVALIGIIVNDGLVLVSKFNTNMKEGMPFTEAVIQAGISRFRAIFLTTVTTVAGLAPLILEKSFQAQFLVPMAISIAYGITAATILTLILLPVLLVALNNFRTFILYIWEGQRPAPETVEPAIKELKNENDDFEN
jgi:multidrug efflux pump subunit AcrB